MGVGFAEVVERRDDKSSSSSSPRKMQSVVCFVGGFFFRGKTFFVNKLGSSAGIIVLG